MGGVLVGHDDDPLALPFAPGALLHAAHRHWLGFDLDPGGLDVPVHGFATDGRREVRPHRPPSGLALHLSGADGAVRITADTPSDEDGPAGSPYVDDEYERGTDVVTEPDTGPVSLTARRVHGAARRAASLIARGARELGGRRGRR